MRLATDRFLVVLFFVAPAEAYRFSQILESHAVDTYEEFTEVNKDLLQTLPVPDVAHEYYGEFMYYFHEFQLSTGNKLEDQKRRPQLNSLFDVFENVLLDEVSIAFHSRQRRSSSKSGWATPLYECAQSDIFFHHPAGTYENDGCVHRLHRGGQ